MKFMHVICILFAVIIIAVIIGFIPVKHAVKRLNEADDYIAVNVEKATISQWIAVGDNKGDYEVQNDVRLTGNAPSGYNYAVEVGHNTFICYGKFDGVGDLHGEKYDIFNVEKWEILYPVKRNLRFDWILPNSYLCRFDMWK